MPPKSWSNSYRSKIPAKPDSEMIGFLWRTKAIEGVVLGLLLALLAWLGVTNFSSPSPSTTTSTTVCSHMGTGSTNTPSNLCP
jgi:hypothetical protein